VLHDLFVATAYLGDLDSAENYARGALEIYCPGHARLLPLAHDVAVLWLKRGQFDRAFPVLLELLDHFTGGKERLLIVGSAGWAAARCGEEAQFHRLSSEALDLVERSTGGEAVPRVLYELGLGAWSLGRWEFAEDLLGRAEMVARLHGEADIQVEAETALLSVRMRQSATPAGAASERTAAGRQTLARHFVATLRNVPVVVEAH
jgi:hypothetical protein